MKPISSGGNATPRARRLGFFGWSALFLGAVAWPAGATTIIGVQPAGFDANGYYTNVLLIPSTTFTGPAPVLGTITLPVSSTAFISGIDFDPISGTLYGTTGSSTGGGRLYSINTTTWAATLFTPPTNPTNDPSGPFSGFTQTPGLTFDTSGNLYSSATVVSGDVADGAVKWDKVSGNFTGAATQLNTSYGNIQGNTSGDSTNHQVKALDSLAINPLNGNMYAGTSRTTNLPNSWDGSPGDLFQIDYTSVGAPLGKATLLGTLTEVGSGNPLTGSLSGLDFDTNGDLYGSLGGGDGRILKINVSTLQFTYLGDAASASVSSLAVSPIVFSVPEPGRFMLLGLGLAALCCRRRRRA